jgi:hypothetical protein
MERYGLALAKTLVDAANEVVYARVFNPGTSDVTVYKHAHIALFTPVCRIGPVVDVQKLSNVCEIFQGLSLVHRDPPRWFSNRFIIQKLNLMGSHICPANLARSGKTPLIRT